MKIIYKYLLREQFLPFLVGVMLIFVIFLLDFLLDILDLIFSKGLSVFLVGELTFYNLVWILAMAFPMGSLVGTISSFGRLSEEGEIVGMRTCGIPLKAIYLTPLSFYLVLSILVTLFSAYLLPEANLKAKTLYMRVARKRPTFTLREGMFNEVSDKYVLFAEKINHRENKLRGVIIIDKSSSPFPAYIEADSARLIEKGDGLLEFLLFSGAVYQPDNEGAETFTHINFDQQMMRVTMVEKGELRAIRGDREMNINLLMERIAEMDSLVAKSRVKIRRLSSNGILALFRGQPKSYIRHLVSSIAFQVKAELQKINSYRRKRASYEVEAHKKVSLPFACFLFPLLGIPLGILSKRGGYLISLAISLIFFILYWAMLIGGEELADRTKISPASAMWAPNVVILLIALWLNYRLILEREIGLPGFLRTVRQRKIEEGIDRNGG